MYIPSKLEQTTTVQRHKNKSEFRNGQTDFSLCAVDVSLFCSILGLKLKEFQIVILLFDGFVCSFSF